MISRKRRPAIVIWFLLLTTLLTYCTSEPETLAPLPTLTPFPPDTYIGLSETAAPLAELVSAAYEADSGRTAPIFIMGSDQILLGDLEQDALEAVIVHHLPAENQAWFSPIALDGLVIMTHPELGVNSLTRSQLQHIFGGSIDNWADVGGPHAMTVAACENS